MDSNIINEYYLIIKNKIISTSFTSALTSIDKFLNSYPNDSKGYYYKGVCNFALEKYNDALYAYIKAVSLDITNAKAYFNLGVTFYMQNKYDDALINIAKALIIFSKTKELDCKKRCAEALNFIKTERKTFN